MLGALLLGCYAAVSGMVDHLVGSEPYMDEVFHVPQTMRYCTGDFQAWDPMITTFPGLYFIFYAFFAAAEAARRTLGLDDAPFLCSVAAMRGMNGIFGVLNFFLFYRLVGRLYSFPQPPSFAPPSPASPPSSSSSPSPAPSDAVRGRYGEMRRVMMALLPHLFPVQFFFYYLYYTDTVSTFFVFLCYYLSLCDRMTLSGLTNVVWVCFIAFSNVLGQYHKHHGGDGYDSIKGLVLYIVQNLRATVARLWLFLVLVFSFLVFLHHNEGIVVGDRTQHSPRPHFVQFFYFLAFSAAWIWPRLLLSLFTGLRQHRRSSLKRTALQFLTGMAIALPVLLYLIHNYTYAHPYLLADNRHYPFYVWKNFFGRNENLKYAYSLIYYVAGFALWKLLGAKVSSMWRIAYFVCTAVVLVPASLLEFRYFIVPFLFLLLHTMPSTNEWRTDSQGAESETTSTPPATRHSGAASKVGGAGEKDRRKKARSGGRPGLELLCMGIECFMFVAVNATTLYIFLHRPFAWPSGEVARLMW